jgi:competence protein ComFC
MLDFLLAVLYPKRCVSCNKEKCGYLCGDCFSRISFHESTVCPVCLKGSIDGRTHPKCMTQHDIVGLMSGVTYGPVVKKLVYKFKYKPYISDLKTIIGKIFCESLEQNELFNQLLKRQPLLLPIPLSKKRLRMRGYNQSELLASYVAQYFALKMNNNLLVRIKETKPQFNLHKDQRFSNMSGAFSINKKYKNQLQNQTILLIDDVATTCSTLRSAAKVLRKNGAGEVYGVTFAKEL